MRFLLIAYDFPPIPSPQALRWAYLVRELALAGHEVHVLAPDVPGYGPGGLPELPGSVQVHRVYPGPLMNFMATRQRRRQARQARYDAEVAHRDALDRSREASGLSAGAPGEGPSLSLANGTAPHADAGLNWKGRMRRTIGTASWSALRLARRGVGWLVRLPIAILGRMRLRVFGQGLNWKGELAEGLKSLMGWWMFPDARAEWMPWARRRLDALLNQLKPDAVITSHEPANAIELGLHARSRGYRWIADLGDPVLAPYTPPRWRKRAFALERAVCDQASIVTVTSAAARDILAERHGLPPERCQLITQGYDAGFVARPGEEDGVTFDPDRLELLYTGSFYSFRRVGDLLAAVLATPGIRLSVATIVAPPELAIAAQQHPERIRLLGFLAHRQALALQRRCDVLVNLANDDPVQIPGKLYEYLGAGVPVLHLGGRPDDAASILLRDTGVGACEPDERTAIAARLADWHARKQRGEPLLGMPEAVSADYRWDRLAHRMALACMPPESGRQPG